MLSRDEHDTIVSHLYAAATGDIAWASVIGGIADRFGFSAAVLVAFDHAQGSLTAETHGHSNELAASYYASEIFRNDPRAQIHFGVRPGQIYHDHALYDVQAMLRDPRVRDTIEMIGVAHQIGVSMRLPHGAPAMLTLLSTEAEGAADEAAVAAFLRLAPHIEQACVLGEIVERSAGTQAVLLEALAAKADGVMLLDLDGCPTFANDGARTILAAGDGLDWANGRFETARAAETRRLGNAVRSALAGRTRPGLKAAGDRLLVTRPSGRRPYIVRVLPAPPQERFMSGAGFGCVVHIHDLAIVRVPSHAILAGVFGLSLREADLAIELVRCAGLGAAAIAAGMAHNTARNHLQGIFRKCDVASQAEAVQLFGRLA